MIISIPPEEGTPYTRGYALQNVIPLGIQGGNPVYAGVCIH